MKFILPFLFFAFDAFAAAPAADPRLAKHFQIDSDLMAYVDRFVQDAKERGVIINPRNLSQLRHLKVQKDFVFSKLVPKDAVALCTRVIGIAEDGSGEEVKDRIIEVHGDRAFAMIEINRLALRFVLYHEFIHCFMDRGHLPESEPFGLMLPRYKLDDLHKMTAEVWKSYLDHAFSDRGLNMLEELPLASFIPFPRPIGWIGKDYPDYR